MHSYPSYKATVSGVQDIVSDHCCGPGCINKGQEPANPGATVMREMRPYFCICTSSSPPKALVGAAKGKLLRRWRRRSSERMIRACLGSSVGVDAKEDFTAAAKSEGGEVGGRSMSVQFLLVKSCKEVLNSAILSWDRSESAESVYGVVKGGVCVGMDVGAADGRMVLLFVVEWGQDTSLRS